MKNRTSWSGVVAREYHIQMVERRTKERDTAEANLADARALAMETGKLLMRERDEWAELRRMYRDDLRAVEDERDALQERLAAYRETLVVRGLVLDYTAPPAPMSSPLGLLPVNSTGMRQLVDAYARLERELDQARDLQQLHRRSIDRAALGLFQQLAREIGDNEPVNFDQAAGLVSVVSLTIERLQREHALLLAEVRAGRARSGRDAAWRDADREGDYWAARAATDAAMQVEP